MALTDDCGMNTTMLVSPASNVGTPYPVYMNGGGASGNNAGSNFGGDGWWIILLFILLAGGWNNRGGVEGGCSGSGGIGTYVIDNGSSVQRGFDQAAIISGINSLQSEITNGFSNASTQLCNCCSDIQADLCNGFAGVNATINSNFANAESAANARQMANMQQAFASQTAMSQGFNSLQSQFADCCCEDRLATADLKYTIATENNADRVALGEGIRDIITNQNNGIQRILDKLCADKIDEKNERIADLQRQLTAANFNASQVAQTATIVSDASRNLSTIANYLNPVAIPAYVVPNPNCCTGNYNYNQGCGCNSGCNSGCGCGSF